MLAADYLGFKNDLNRKGIIMSFSGCISESILFSLGETLKHQMRLEETDTRTEKRVFSVFVELVQNIIRYSAESAGTRPGVFDLATGVISVGVADGKFFIVCANTVQRDNVAFLRERLNLLRDMSREEMRRYYRQKLREPAEGDSKGASIGLVEIARRASEPIEFDFVDIDEEKVFFGLKACI